MEADDLLELMLNAAVDGPYPSRIDGVVVGRIIALGPRGEPLVDFAERTPSDPVIARSIAPIAPSDVGRDVALLFEGGDPNRPVLMGFMYAPVAAEPTSTSEQVAVVSEAKTIQPALPSSAIERDGERLVFSAEREIVLRCGQASITLTRAGKILIRGAYLLARSSGVNRIQGGSVQIN